MPLTKPNHRNDIRFVWCFAYRNRQNMHRMKTKTSNTNGWFSLWRWNKNGIWNVYRSSLHIWLRHITTVSNMKLQMVHVINKIEFTKFGWYHWMLNDDFHFPIASKIMCIRCSQCVKYQIVYGMKCIWGMDWNQIDDDIFNWDIRNCDFCSNISLSFWMLSTAWVYFDGFHILAIWFAFHNRINRCQLQLVFRSMFIQPESVLFFYEH